MATKTRPPYAETVEKDPTYKHAAYVDWLTKNTGYEVDAKTVQLTQSLVSQFRESEEYAAAVAGHVPVRERIKADVERRKQEKIAAKKAKLLAELAALNGGAAVVVQPEEPEPEPEPPAPKKAPAKKAAAKKATSNVTPIKSGAKKAPAARKAPAKSAAAATAAPASVVVDDDDDF